MRQGGEKREQPNRKAEKAEKREEAERCRTQAKR